NHYTARNVQHKRARGANFVTALWVPVPKNHGRLWYDEWLRSGFVSYIRFVHVRKTFKEGERERAVLSDVDTSFAAGEFIAIVGRSGSGKSTLLNLLAGLDLPTQGEIWAGEKCISGMSDRGRTLFRREHVGFVFQFFNLIPTLTVGENVGLTAELGGMSDDQARTQSEHLLDEVGLLDRAHSFTDK